MRRIGLLGGAFNPPHFGHLKLATLALEHLDLEELRIMPAGQSPLKAAPTGISTAQRLALVRAAFAELDPRIRLERLEPLPQGIVCVERVHGKHEIEPHFLCRWRPLALQEFDFPDGGVACETKPQPGHAPIAMFRRIAVDDPASVDGRTGGFFDLIHKERPATRVQQTVEIPRFRRRTVRQPIEQPEQAADNERGQPRQRDAAASAVELVRVCRRKPKGKLEGLSGQSVRLRVLVERASGSSCKACGEPRTGSGSRRNFRRGLCRLAGVPWIGSGDRSGRRFLMGGGLRRTHTM